ncbi:MAG: response regulator, partial [Muribaculum sp.]|nr:response regulator [Muribaculum sp.]
ATEKQAQRPTALLVDDNHDLLDFMRDELSTDFNIITASDGTEALKILADRKTDIIVTDLMMPHMDGIELCRRLKTDPKTLNTPIIVVTAKQDVRSVVEGLTVGADDYVTKPFNNEVLRLKMKRLVDLRLKGATRTPLMPEPEKVQITSLAEKLIERAVKYVEDNISRSDLSVEELSKALGMSRVHLYKKILHITGKTPIEFIRILRLKRATQYLRESQLNVSEIAYQLGFNNPKYFSKYFQEEFGISPSEYQKREGI